MNITPASIRAIDEIDERVANSRARRARQAQQRKAASDKKFIVVMACIAAVVLLGAVIAHSVSDNARFEYAKSLPVCEVVVSQGDTIDGIAAEHPVSGLSAHELGYVISELNEGSHSVPLQPGDRLMVPDESNA